jgi:hypothetical protein
MGFIPISILIGAFIVVAFLPDWLFLKKYVILPQRDFVVLYQKLTWVTPAWFWVNISLIVISMVMLKLVLFPSNGFPQLSNPFLFVFIYVLAVMGLPRALFEIFVGVSVRTLGSYSLGYFVGPKVRNAGFLRVLLSIMALLVLAVKAVNR